MHLLADPAEALRHRQAKAVCERASSHEIDYGTQG